MRRNDEEASSEAIKEESGQNSFTDLNEWEQEINEEGKHFCSITKRKKKNTI